LPCLQATSTLDEKHETFPAHWMQSCSSLLLFHNMRFKLNLQPEAALCRIDHPATFLHFFPSSSDVIFSSFFLFSLQNIIHFASYSSACPDIFNKSHHHVHL
jgi:hypothetical protein